MFGAIVSGLSRKWVKWPWFRGRGSPRRRWRAHHTRRATQPPRSPTATPGPWRCGHSVLGGNPRPSATPSARSHTMACAAVKPEACAMFARVPKTTDRPTHTDTARFLEPPDRAPAIDGHNRRLGFCPAPGPSGRTAEDPASAEDLQKPRNTQNPQKGPGAGCAEAQGAPEAGAFRHLGSTGSTAACWHLGQGQG